MMIAANNFCPKCGEHEFKAEGDIRLVCTVCDFVFYRNAAAATAAIIRCKDEILITVRAKEPCKGLLDLPGGFVDPGEGLEQGLRRELTEELGLYVEDMRYITSLANNYLYRDVLYATCDAFFELVYDEKPEVSALDEIAAVRWVSLKELDTSQLAFDSQRQVLEGLRLALVQF